MNNIKIQVIKIEDDKFYICIESHIGSWAQTICNKKDMLEMVNHELNKQ